MKKMTKPHLFNAMSQARCPACREGEVFHSYLGMNKSCTVCGTVFEREHGFFLMAVFVGYMMNAVLLAPLALYGYFANQLIPTAILIIVGILLLVAPTFRYSRIVWLYLDQMLDPRRDSFEEMVAQR